MKRTNYEIKARSSEEHQESVRDFLNKNSAKFLGTDNQTDTYFKVPEGRMKIRKGDIENFLIFYNRENLKAEKKSEVEIYPLQKHPYLERITRKTYEILAEIKKTREIYFIENVKFHIDSVESLGKFVEIEAISENDDLCLENLARQCRDYKELLEIRDEDLISESYSDILLGNQNEGKISALGRKT